MAENPPEMEVKKQGDTLIDWKDKALTHKLADTKWSM